MSAERSKDRFREQIVSQKRELRTVEKIVEVNEYLQAFNWAYVHPYVIGLEVELFDKMRQEGSGTTEAIFRIFARSFYDLKSTAAFIEGIFKKRKSLAPFGLLIDQAVVLALQKEYAGAISLLVPVIEGSLRHYLVTIKGQPAATLTKSVHLLKAFQYMEDDYVAHQQQALENDEEGQRYNLPPFDANQRKQLLANEQAYIKKWLSIAKSYLAHNLYLDTRTGVVADKLNRHAIVHGFTTDIYYSFDNFLRLYHLLFFLSWAYGISTKGTSLLIDVDDEVLLQKWGALEKIRLITKLTDEAKVAIYATHPDFDQSIYLQAPPISKVSQLIDSAPAFSIEHRLRFVDETIQRICFPEEFAKQSASATKTERAVRILLKWILRK
jgi:hypothetical protein